MSRLPLTLNNARSLAFSLALAGVLLLQAACSAADETNLPAEKTALSGTVVRVADGDSFTLETERDVHVVVRIAEVDAPELNQPYGREARRVLSDLILNRELRLVVQTTDTHGRTVARPYRGDTDVAAELVRSGAAWVFLRFLREQELVDLETEAKNAGRGLWALPAADRIAPWDWREQHPRTVTVQPADTGGGCRIKGNISSTGERIYHLPGQQNYDVTRITTSKGERWFCTEAQAQTSGWRKAKI